MNDNFHILVLGLSHKSAPVEVREKLAISSANIVPFLEKLVKHDSIKEALVIPTCNRVEVYSVVKNLSDAIETEKKALSEAQNIGVSDFEVFLYAYSGIDAVRHIFRVASSIDSMIIGEPQILGQVKEAYRQSINARTAGPILNKLMHRAFHAAKRVRTESGIGKAAVSVSYAAVELATKIFGSLKGKKVLAMGAGDMGELVIKHLIQNDVGEIFVTNRTYSRAEEIARTFGGHPVPFENFTSILKDIDILICSTGAPYYLITPQNIKEIMPLRNYAPMFFIDISVPRNIDPEINNIENAYLYDIDDLEEVIWGNIKKREQDAKIAEQLIEEEVNAFLRWLEELKIVPTIVSLKDRVMQLSEEEFNEAIAKLKGINEEQKKVIRNLVEATINKILHYPITTLKRMQHNGESYIYMDTLKKLFELEGHEDGEKNSDRNERK
jgi:glutamyl-tRNA reductase